MATNNLLVLVLGGTGVTGTSVVDGLLKSGNSRVAMLVRPGSVAKPIVAEWKASGVEIRVGDLTDDYAELKEHLQGVDILISAVDGRIIAQQREIIRAAKEVGVQRVVPCEWATPGKKGFHVITDMKYEIREYCQKLGVPYTIIDVGFWMQFFLPLPLRSAVQPELKALSWMVYRDGESKNLVTNLHHIGKYVAKVIADPRTINKTVIIWEDEVTQKDAHEIGALVSGDGDALRAQRIQVSEEDIQQRMTEGRAFYEKNPMDPKSRIFIWTQFMYSMHFLQENTLENAKRLGYLDARSLYPDISAQSLGEYAKEFYSMSDPGEVLVRD